MKIVIVMTYYDRQKQLCNTLRSIAKSKYENFEVVIVDDGSSKSPNCNLSSFPVTILTRPKNKWKCSSAAFNTGIYYAMLQKPDILIIQSAECFHIGDIISRASELRENEYLTFGCYSVNEETTFRNNFESLSINNIGASHDGQNAWYNHPIYRPKYYHFCSAISASDMRKLNGFEERLMEGVGYEDDNFLARVRLLGLEVKIIENPFVIHQWHYNQVRENLDELVKKNKLLNIELLKEQNYKAHNSLSL